MIGVDPHLFTLRELTWMSEGKGMADWWHTASLVATVRNLMLSPGDKPISPVDFHPMRDRIEGMKPKPKVTVSDEDRRIFEREMARVEGQKLARDIASRQRTRG